MQGEVGVEVEVEVEGCVAKSTCVFCIQHALSFGSYMSQVSCERIGEGREIHVGVFSVVESQNKDGARRRMEGEEVVANGLMKVKQGDGGDEGMVHAREEAQIR